MIEKLCKQEGVALFGQGILEPIAKNFQSATRRRSAGQYRRLAAAGAGCFQCRLAGHNAQAAPKRPKKPPRKRRATKAKTESRSAPLTLKGPDPRHGRALRALLPSVAGRSDRRHRHHRQGRHHPHDRLRNAGKLRAHARTLDRCRLGRRARARKATSLVGRLSVVLTNQPNSFGTPDDRHRQERRQYHQSQDHQPHAGFLRCAGRCRGRGCQTPDRYHRRAARHGRDQFGRAHQGSLTGSPVTSPRTA